MEPFNREKFENLANVHDKQCISIYLSPPHSEPDRRQQSVIKLKNIYRDLMNRLQEYGIRKDEGQRYLKPIENLLELNHELWTHPSKGVAIFLHSDDVKIFRFPVSFEETFYLADHFYLLPLAELINLDWKFYVLSVSINKTRLLRGSFYEIEEVDIEDEIPQSLTDALGADFVERSLQFRSREDSNLNPYYHGHGSGSELEKKDELLKYFLLVDRGLNNMLNSEKTPLIFAGVDFLFPIYRQANKYQGLLDTPILGNHDDPDLKKLHRRALEILHPHYEKEKGDKKAKFHELLNKGLSSYEIKRVIPATIAGRIDTLFVKKNESFPGKYFREDNTIAVHADIEPGNADLLNMAAVETILHNGKVYLVNGDEMPDENSPVNAILRY